MDERKMFEAWIDSREGSSLRSGFDGSLDYPLGNIMWEVWQAARRTTPEREAIVEEIAEMVDHMGEGRRLEEYVGAIRDMKSGDKGGA
ncbi:hypothetical protein [Burkholderia vietnamiensis]|uniref:hypothetical protein n=1 Tax=Burkholderia vietnamiensis TaxID=60552 RepID=UPI001BA2FBF2|nr:hypothetical protein [Burkholderia vietnamiensis]MBR8030834.1 hypothetical protein [Burkholderia vietnamiensis]